MIKKLLLFVFLLLAVMTLAACGDSDDPLRGRMEDSQTHQIA